MMNVKEARKQLGLSQDRFAARLGIAPYTVRRWEAGKARPSPMARRAILEVFGIEIDK
jgi:DNA-binding transcriptional regulator YiaG